MAESGSEILLLPLGDDSDGSSSDDLASLGGRDDAEVEL